MNYLISNMSRKQTSVTVLILENVTCLRTHVGRSLHCQYQMNTAQMQSKNYLNHQRLNYVQETVIN